MLEKLTLVLFDGYFEVIWGQVFSKHFDCIVY